MMPYWYGFYLDLEQFSWSNYEQKKSYKDKFAEGKNDPPGLPVPKITQA